MTIEFYKHQYRENFIELNLAWLNKYFKVEPQDLEMFNEIEDLISNGAAIYFALENNNVIATCMVIPKGDDTWEICKLATDEKYRGQGLVLLF